MDNNTNNNEMNENVQNTEEIKAVEAPASAGDAVHTEPETTPVNETTASTTNEPANAEAQNNTNQSSTSTNSTPDFSKYRDTTSNYVRTPRQTVYINNNPAKKIKTPKAKLGAGAVAAIVAVCMVFSGGAAFAGTYAANKMSANSTTQSGSGSGSTSSGSPSVIFQSFSNGNKTAGTYEQVATAVTPTVVEITTESVTTDTSFWGGGNYIVSGAGSGVIISEDGLIITNNHVVSGANSIKVKLSDGTEYDATLVGTDSESDIAVIKVDATGLPCALIGDSDSLKVGQEVVAVGNPLGEFGGSVTNGIVSGLSRDVTIDGTEMTLIQTNAAVNPGNSGGGLFNLYGELIGVVNAKSSTTSSGTSVEGIGFAIPIDSAIEVATELTNYGYVRGRVMLGITYVDITSSWDAMRYGVNSLGVYVGTSQYEENDLRSGDRIVAIDDTEVEYSTDIKAALKGHSVGDVLTVKVVRNGKYVDVKVTLHEYVPTTSSTDTSKSFEDKAASEGAKG